LEAFQKDFFKLTHRAWQKMLSGRRLDLINPSPLDIEIEDIAHGLAFQARWNGQTLGDFTFSVANHSILVQEIFQIENPNLKKSWYLAALLHDSAEYVIGDLISPVKAFLGDEYAKLEQSLLEAIHIRFGLPAKTPNRIKDSIKKADKKAAWLEATQIAGFTELEANKIFLKPNAIITNSVKINLKDPLKSKQEFLDIYCSLH
tara:strand:+ start:686 stop:1294 length:609 start_codon:yes stop_codon:yes gene_type:complete